jgi:flavin-dependent dehydrogenase
MLADAPRIGRTRIFLSGGGFEAPIDPPAASISRYELDQELWAAAQRAGVDARQECGICTVEPNENGFTVSGPGARLECSQAIYATGRDAMQKRRAGAFVGLKAHFHCDEPIDSVDLYFARDGYCGVQPLGSGQLNVCAMVKAEAVKAVGQDRMSAVFALHPKLKENNWKQVTETVATAALGFGVPEPVQDGVICAGDQAGFIDPFLGDGISLALQTGAMAGTCDNPEQYRHEYQRRFLPVFRRAGRLRRLLAAPAPLQKTALLMLKWPGVAAAVVERTRASARNACLLRRD